MLFIVHHIHLLFLIHQQLQDLLESSDDTENTKSFRDTSKVDMRFRTNVLSTSINSSRKFVSCEDTSTVDSPSTSETTIQSTSRFLYTTSHKSEQDAVNVVRDVKNLESNSEDITSTSDATIQSTSRFLHTSHESELDAVNVVEDVKHLESESKDIISTSEASIQSTSRFLHTSHKFEQDAVNVAGDVKNSESESECAMDRSCLVTSLVYECDKNTQDYEDLIDAKQELTQFHNGMTG